MRPLCCLLPHTALPPPSPAVHQQVFKLYGGAQGFLLATNVAEPDANHAATMFAFAQRLMQVALHVSAWVAAGGRWPCSVLGWQCAATQHEVVQLLPTA